MLVTHPATRALTQGITLVFHATHHGFSISQVKRTSNVSPTVAMDTIEEGTPALNAALFA